MREVYASVVYACVENNPSKFMVSENANNVLKSDKNKIRGNSMRRNESDMTLQCLLEDNTFINTYLLKVIDCFIRGALVHKLANRQQGNGVKRFEDGKARLVNGHNYCLPATTKPTEDTTITCSELRGPTPLYF